MVSKYYHCDYSIRVYRSFTAIFYKCMNIVANVYKMFPAIMFNAFSIPLCSKLCLHTGPC